MDMRACINIFSFSHLFNLLHFSISVSNCRVTPVHFSSYVNGTEILSGLMHLSFYLEAFPNFFQPLIILLFFNVCLPQISAINPPDLFTSTILKAVLNTTNQRLLIKSNV